MINRSLTVLRWCLSLGKKFIIVAPWATLAVIVTTLVSQVGLMLSAFLPLKIVILLGSDRIPRYFPASFADIDRPVLLAGLSLATVGAFVAHVAAERLSVWSSEYGARALLARSQKMALFENQDELAQSSYQRYSRALAGAFFAALVFGLLAVIYPKMALVLGAYVVLAVLGVRLIWQWNESFRDNLESNLGQVIAMTANVGFMVGFLWLVIDFVALSPPGMLVAIISLLFSRLALQRLGGFITELAGLNRQRVKLDALYFHGKALMPDTQSGLDTFWPLLQPGRRWWWIQPVLEEIGGLEQGTGGELDPDIRWHQLRVRQVAALSVDRPGAERFLVKLFGRSCRRIALHEATLLGSGIKRLPASPWLGTTLVDGYQCHVFDLDQHQSLPSPTKARKHLLEVAETLLAVEPPTSLLHRYQRSRLQLHQRIQTSWFETLAVAATSRTCELIEWLKSQQPQMCQYLLQLPPVIVNPDMVAEHLLIHDKQVVAVHWGDWRVEPLGCGWPVGTVNLQVLPAALKRAARLRPELGDCHPLAVGMAALLYALERLIVRERLSDAIDLLPRLEEHLKQLSVGSKGGKVQSV